MPLKERHINDSRLLKRFIRVRPGLRTHSSRRFPRSRNRKAPETPFEVGPACKNIQHGNLISLTFFLSPPHFETFLSGHVWGLILHKYQRDTQDLAAKEQIGTEAMDGPRARAFLLLLCALCLTLTGILSKHIDHRNLFTQRVCCRRQSHFVYIGQDISGSPVSVDVGMCRSHCVGASRPEAGQQEYSQHSSMLEFLRSKKMRRRRPSSPQSPLSMSQQPSCGTNQACEPTGMRVDRLLLFDGPREVEMIEECHCEITMIQCVRVPALKTYYSETPYETVIDVGGCSRSKGPPEGFSCVPTKFESALVETPNKADIIQTVAACELKENCYRSPYVEYHYEIVHHADGVKEERLKEIDVGRCLGGCSAGNRCLLRSPSDAETCLLWTERQSNSCVPRGYESHSFLNQHGQIRTVLSITSCLCQNTAPSTGK
ncbi:uncharacterized protein pnhd [Brachionichthys hirsutus]|uniref:uncharacterized protein pnhd n=1 Tax=Brachionichthys hirsutus TaxID=412623 RepID=UPI003604DCC9